MGKQRHVKDKSCALYMHCAAHSLNLVMQDAVAAIPAYHDALS